MKSRRMVSTRSRSVMSRLITSVLPVAVGHELHREHVVAAPRLPQGERLAVVLPLQVFDELRLAHQEGDALPEVARAVEPEMLLGHGIAPLDAVGRVQYHQAVGHRRARLPEILERGGELRLALALAAQHAVEIARRCGPTGRGPAAPFPGTGSRSQRLRSAMCRTVVAQQRREHGHGGDAVPLAMPPRAQATRPTIASRRRIFRRAPEWFTRRRRNETAPIISRGPARAGDARQALAEKR